MSLETGQAQVRPCFHPVPLLDKFQVNRLQNPIGHTCSGKPRSADLSTRTVKSTVQKRSETVSKTVQDGLKVAVNDWERLRWTAKTAEMVQN